MNFALQGLYKVLVVDARTKRVLWEQPEWRKNLILNDGFERIATNFICENFLYAYAGTGTRSNNTDSSLTGDTAACDSLGNVTLNVGSTVVFDLGTPGEIANIIKWTNTGFEGRILTTPTSRTATIVPVGSSQTGSFVLYKTNQYELQSETARTSTYFPASPWCGTGIVGNEVVHQRTWDFAEETTLTTYHEMGVGWSMTALSANTTFSRFLLHSPVSVDVGQQLRLIYQLRLVMVPSAATAKTANIVGMSSTTGYEQFTYLGLSKVLATGVTSYADAAGYSNEPCQSTGIRIFVSPDNTAISTGLGATPVDRVSGAFGKDVTSPGYVAYSGQRIKEVTLAVGEGNMTIGSMGVGSGTGYVARDYGLVFVFDTPQVKDSSKTLNLQFYWNWKRVLQAD
jgi:hypothetical protein